MIVNPGCTEKNSKDQDGKPPTFEKIVTVLGR